MSFNDFNQVAVFCTEFTVSVSDTITSFDPGSELVMPQTSTVITAEFVGQRRCFQKRRVSQV